MNEDDKLTATRKAGLPFALGAYLIWGFLPLYLILVRTVPPFEFVAWRIVWTLPFCLLIVAFRRQWDEIRSTISDLRTLAILLATAALIAVNWFLYVWAIQRGHIYAASLGYYINPLITVALGTIVLKERVSRLGWCAVAIATAGVALLVGGPATTLWISLTLGASFAVYGLLRKQVATGSLPGLTIESAILVLPATGIAAWYANQPQGSSFGGDPALSLAIMLGGVLTAMPLLLFAIAARRMDYSVLGFTQFLAPTIVFFLGLFVFEQQLEPVQLASFVVIWIACAVFAWDRVSAAKRDAI